MFVCCIQRCSHWNLLPSSFLALPARSFVVNSGNGRRKKSWPSPSSRQRLGLSFKWWMWYLFLCTCNRNFTIPVLFACVCILGNNISTKSLLSPVPLPDSLDINSIPQVLVQACCSCQIITSNTLVPGRLPSNFSCFCFLSSQIMWTTLIRFNILHHLFAP